MLKKPVYTAIVCFSLAATIASAQNVFVLPGAGGSGNSAQVLSSQFTNVGTVSVGNSPFLIIPKPDGTKYYAIAASGSQTVTSFDPNFQNPRSLGSLGATATAAAITPDGKKLLVIAGTLHVYDTTSDTDLTPNGVVAGTSFTDVAVNLEGSRAYLLGTQQNGQGILYAIDLTSNSFAPTGNLPLNNLTTSLAVGPNDFVYVGGVNRVYEINPATLTVTSAGEIQTIIKAGRLAFTPDGRYLLVPNASPGPNQPAVVLIDLVAHTVGAQSTPIANALITQILVASPTVAFGFSTQTSSLYQFSIPTLSLSAPTYPGVSGIAISGAALSNDIAGGTHNTTQTLFLLSAGNAYKIDIPTNAVSNPVALNTATSQAIAVTGPFTSNTTTPATILTYGSNQVLSQGAVSMPVVARVLDSNGNPVFGAAVTFSSASSVTISNPTVTTGAGGYAVTTITGTASGSALVTATAGSATANYNFTIGGGTGGSGTPTGGLSIIAGQGQILFQNNNTNIAGFGSPLLVKVTDANGNPVPNPQVTYEIATGFGSLFPGISLDGTTTYAGAQTPDGMGLIIT
ncbi:MAG: Ig-like domain-containing protein, partial [Acidobacteriaceae bacterium]|nr:Ig-like domain-containing protein [Acidobacteriaceae bacterium]